MLDECLSWNAHIEMLGNKISKAIGIINHLKFIYPQRILFTSYNSLIISHNLCSTVSYYGENQITCKQLISYRKEPCA